MAEIRTLRGGELEDQSSLQDIPAMLERVAKGIREGEYGECVRTALVLRCNGQAPIVFGHGDTFAAQTFEDLHAGALQLLMMDNPERE